MYSSFVMPKKRKPVYVFECVLAFLLAQTKFIAKKAERENSENLYL